MSSPGRLAIAVLEDHGKAHAWFSSTVTNDELIGHRILSCEHGDVLLVWVNLTREELRTLPLEELLRERDIDRGIKEFISSLKDLYKKRRQCWAAEMLIVSTDRIWRIGDRFAVVAETHPHTAIGSGACIAEQVMSRAEYRNNLPIQSMLAHAATSTWNDDSLRCVQIKEFHLK